MAGENSLVIVINGSAKNFLDELDKVKKETQDLEKILTSVAKNSAIAFAAFAGTIALVTKEFANYEKALVGVGKTTNIEGKRLENFGKQFQRLSSEIPVSTNELLGIAQAAGQLGVEGEDNLLKFTETIAKLGVATDLTGEQAATALTRILNVTGEGIESIDTFGSVIVALGNNFAATESEIVKVATEVSRSTAVFGVGSAEAAALATALKSVGVQAQLGGSAVGRAFREIDASIRSGGQSLENLAQITGIAGDQLKETFAEDSALVFQRFIEGIGEIAAAGGDTTAALEAFNLKGDEILKVLPVLAKNAELVGEAFATAGAEVNNATALNEEARRAFDTLSSEATKVSNNFTTLQTNIGEQLAPAVTELLRSVNQLLVSFNNLDEETISSLASFLKWGAAITASVASVATLATGFLKLRGIIRGLRVAFTAGRLAVIGFTSAATFGLSAILGFLPEIISGVSALVDKFSEGDEPQSLENITEELKNINAEIAELEERRPSLRGDEIVNLKDLKDRRDELQKLSADLKAVEDARQVGVTAEFTGPLEGFDEELFGADATTNIPERSAEELAEIDKAEKAKQEKVKESEEKQTALRDEATANRIEKLKRDNQLQRELQSARNDADTEEERQFLERKAQIENEFRLAREIKDAEERALALENLRLKNEEELNEIEEFENQKAERDAQRREEKAALDEELRELEKEQQAVITEEDRQILQERLDTQKEAEEKFAKDRLARRVEERNKFKQDELKFGTEIANVKAFFRREEVQGVKSATGQLVQLTQSRNSTLKGIGKAAARVQAAIKTAEGAISAYASLSGIPIIGPALGAAAAAAIIAFGVEQQQKISAARTGGFVPPQSRGAIDNVPTLLEAGELVVPRAIAPNFIQSVGNPSNGDFANSDATDPDDVGNGEMMIRLEGDLIQNEEFVAGLATKLRDLQEFENVRLS